MVSGRSIISGLHANTLNTMAAVDFMLALMLVLSISTGVLAVEPQLRVHTKNVTINVGETATLPCTVQSLGDKYKVVWKSYTKPSSPRLLTMGLRRIINDIRFSVERPYDVEWNLLFRSVQLNDSGMYHCIINTDPVQTRRIRLIVNEPAKILDDLSTRSPIEVREGDTVELLCNATGTPPPEVTWVRKSKDEDSSKDENILSSSMVFDRPRKQCDMNVKAIHSPGEVLIIHNITRYCGEVYQCVASNGVGQPDTRDIKVDVQFAPEVYLPTKRITQSLGKSTVLECQVRAFPHTTSVWRRHGRDIMSDQDKYEVIPYSRGTNLIVFSLKINKIEAKDYGEYECFALNGLGSDSEKMVMGEVVPLPTTTTTTQTPVHQPMAHLDPDHSGRIGHHGNQEYYNRGYGSKHTDFRGGQSEHTLDRNGPYDDNNGYRRYNSRGRHKQNRYGKDGQSDSVIADPSRGRNAALKLQHTPFILLTVTLIYLIF